MHYTKQCHHHPYRSCPLPQSLPPQRHRAGPVEGSPLGPQWWALSRATISPTYCEGCVGMERAY